MSKRRVDELFHHLRFSTEESAFHCQEQSLSFGELYRRGNRYGVLLEHLGVQKGDRVLSLLPSSLGVPEFVVGHLQLGVIHVPVNTNYRELELAHIITDAAPKVILVGAQEESREILARMTLPAEVEKVLVVGGNAFQGRPKEESLDALLDTLERATKLEPSGFNEKRELFDDDLALFIYTSGTTGPSKGVQHTYGSIATGIGELTTLWQWTPRDRLVLALPLFHVHGLGIGIYGTLLKGNQTEILPRFTPFSVGAAFKRGGTIFMGVPTMHHRLVQAMEEDHGLAKEISKARLITSGSAALRPALFRRYQELTGLSVLERYGMSETLLTFSNPYEVEKRRIGSVGFPLPSIEYKVVDEQGEPVGPDEPGELLLRGPSVTPGYWRLPEKTKEAFDDEGYFRTGDVATVDEEGYLSLQGRKSVDIIKCGGYKISAREIEEALQELPGIAAIAVVGIPDREWGERIVAAIVAEEDLRDLSPQEWLTRLQSPGLASFKIPREVLLYPQGLPRNALGKIQKHRIISSVETH